MANNKNGNIKEEHKIHCLVSSFSSYQNFLVADDEGNLAGTAIRNKNPKGHPIGVILPLKFANAANKIIPGLRQALEIEPVLTQKNVIVNVKEFEIPSGQDSVIFVSGVDDDGEEQIRFYGRAPEPEIITLEVEGESVFKTPGTRITYIALDKFRFMLSIENAHNKTLLLPKIPAEGLSIVANNPDDLYLLQAVWPELDIYTRYKDGQFILFSQILANLNISDDLVQVRKDIGDSELVVTPSGKFLEA